jgi:lipoprotein-releasing system permease protein
VKTGPVFFIALRYLLGRAREGGRYLRGAAAGIALSLIPIMVTLIVADGMIRGITDRYLELGTGHLEVFSYGEDAGIETARFRIAASPGIRGVWAERQGLGLIMGGAGKAGATIRATEPSFWEDEGSARFLTVIAGSGKPESGREVLLGQELAKSVGAEAGETVYIMSIRVSPEGRNIPRTLPFTVKGIVSSGYRELDSLWCIMTWEGGERLLAPELSHAYLMVKIDDPYGGADSAALALRRLLGYGYGVYTWKELQRSQYSSYESTRQLLLFIMALIVIVAAVNVSSAASMLAIERQRDIAVLKAAGAGPADTGRIFLWASFLTGLTGAVIGIGLGLLIGVFVNPLIHGLEKVLSFFSGLFHGREVKILDPGYYLERIPVIISWKTVLLIGFFTVLCSVLASWIPARKAGKTPPVELLRKL